VETALVRFRTASLLAAVALLANAGVAEATITSSNITAPRSGYLQSNDYPPSPTQITVTGTSDGTTGDFVDIDCWYGTTNQHRTLVSNVPVAANGSFTVTAPLSGIASAACRLRAEPHVASTESSAFTGPALAVSEFSTNYSISGGPNHGKLDDYYASGQTFGSYVGWDSAGDCGPYQAPYDSHFAAAAFAINCNGALYRDDGFSRSEIQVDGHNAYAVAEAYYLFSRSGTCTATVPPFTNCDGSRDNAGYPALAVSQSWNPANGFESTHSAEGIVKCTGADGYKPANQAACPAFAASGVQLSRSTAMSQGGRSTTMTDTWSSTDGHAHTVDLLYDDYNAGISNSGYQFPGQTSFSTHVKGDSVPGSTSAPGTIYIKSKIDAADGDTTQSIGAVTFSNAPSRYVFSAPWDVQEHELLSVPASGSATLTFIYSDGYSIAPVVALAHAAEDQIKPAAVTITTPVNGSRSTTRTVTVSGAAVAGSGVSSLAVAGHAVAVGTNGAWSTGVRLAIGTNTIVASATDRAGRSASARVAVLYGCVVPKTKGLKLSAAKKLIHKAACRVGKVSKVHSRVKRGHVIRTNPGKGSKRQDGAKVGLVVSEGPKKK
jgi:hypothetical protein